MNKPHSHFFSLGLGLFFLTIIISSLGLLFVFESSLAESFSTFGHPYHYIQSQAIWLVIGFFSLLITSFMPIKFWKTISPLLFLASLLMLILVFIPGIGMRLNGANRWFSLGGLVTIQPVEFVKLSICIFFAAWMSKHQKLLPFLFLTSLPVGLLLLQPDLGSTLVVMALSLGLFYIAGGKMKYISFIIGLSLILVSIVIFSSGYRRQRIVTFLNPELDPLGSSFHIRQITLALGRGGLFGQGLGESKQKFNYIPEASSDSILAIVAEEIGFVGTLGLIVLYLSLFLIIYKIATRYPPGSFEYILTIGFLIWLSSQTLLNIAAVVALAPLTGIPLPFFSYGGSSLVMVMLASGILIKLAKKS